MRSPSRGQTMRIKGGNPFKGKKLGITRKELSTSNIS